MHNPIPAALAIYARKSTESEDRQVLSIDSQVKELKGFAEREGIRVSQVFVESKSAKSPGRPVFNELFSLVQQGKIDAIMVWKLDRVARNPVDGGAVIWAMEEKKLQALYTPQRVFVNTSDNKFWMQLEFGMAKKYVDDLSDNVKRGIRARIGQGWKAGLAPLGYLNDRNTRTIVKDPERFALVRKMFDFILSGNYTAMQVTQLANKRWGLRTRKSRHRGDNPLAHSTVYDLLKNPFYYGQIVHNGEYSKGAHEPMISKVEFDQVQTLLGRDTNTRPEKYHFAYTGMIRCGECGASVTAEHKRNRYGRRYIYYHCTHKKIGTRCRQKVIEVRKLESQILGFLDSLSIPRALADWAIRVMRESNGDEVEKSRLTRQSLNRRLLACQDETRRLVDMRLKRLLNDEEFLEKKRQLENERNELEESLRMPDSSDSGFLMRSMEALNFASVVKKTFENGDEDSKRACLQYLGSNLELRDGILRIQPQKPFSFMQKALKSSGAEFLGFEPPAVGQPLPKNSFQKSVISVWSGLAYEVRTFYWDHRSELALFALPDILKNSIKYSG